jgi:hypothetical protein
MGNGYLPDSIMLSMLDMAKLIDGDFMEMGVLKGGLFKRIVKYASKNGKMAHAVDSFIGMNDPSDMDGERYPKGRFDIGGPNAFINIMREEGLDDDLYQIWPGYMPEGLNDFPENKKLSFVYIDFDHHDPTEMAIEWAVPRLIEGSIIGFDDYFPKRKLLASPPIDRFIDESGDSFELLSFSNNQIFMRKI